MHVKIKFRGIKSVTLVELMVSTVIVGILILSFYGFETFSNTQVIAQERRAKVQNELVYPLEHMSKYIQQANGNINDPGIKVFPPGNPTGFQVRVDFNGTPSDLTDDPWVRYRLRPPGNILEVTCNGGSGCPATFPEDLTAKLRSGFVDNTLLPEPLPANPSGFYVRVDDAGSSINIGLVGRYAPTQAVNMGATGFINPQVSIKTKVLCSSCSTN